MMFSAIPAILLFAMSIPVIMHFRIWPVETTPYWLFGLVFFTLIGKVFVDVYPRTFGRWNRAISFVLLIIVLSVVIGGTTYTAISDRHKIAPQWGTHDIVLQLEAAMRYLLQGKNPYKETYFNTPVELFRYSELGKDAVNPALYHFVMPPWYLLFPFPVYWIANRTLGYFDVRLVSLFSLAAIVIVLWRWFKDPVLKEISIILVALSPAVTHYFIEGRSDTFALVWLVYAVFLLHKRKLLFSAIVIGLGMMSKQTLWFAFPLWIQYSWLTLRVSDKSPSTIFLKTRMLPSNKKIKFVFYVLIAMSTAVLVMLPFLIWDAEAFINSVILYLSAGGETGYPVSGYGFSMILFEHGFIASIKDYFPFTVFQLGIGLPVLGVLQFWINKKPTISKFFLSYGVFLFIIWYFSRYFNNSHIAFLSTIFVLGVLFHYEEQITRSAKKA